MFPPLRNRKRKDLEFKPTYLSSAAASTATSKRKKGSAATETKAKAKPASSASGVSNGAPIKKKILGVRRVLAKDDDDLCDPLVSFDGRCHEHPVIKYLAQNNPQLLGRALSVRNPIAALENDYILSLLSSRVEVRRDNPIRKRSAAALSLSQQQQRSIDSGGTQRPSSRRRRKADDILGSLGVDDGDTSLKRDVQALLDQQQQQQLHSRKSPGAVFDNALRRSHSLIDGDDDEDLDLASQCITKSELEYLRDVLISQKGHESSSFAVEEDAEEVDDLTWLVQKFDRDFENFVTHSQAEGHMDPSSDENISSGNAAGAASKAKYRFKASMTLSRKSHCAIGTFATMDAATLAYDRMVLARRTLGKLLLQEHQIRRLVKASRAAHHETLRALERDDVTPVVAAKRAQAAATDAFKAAETDAFLTSEKVQRPELNTDGADCFYDSIQEMEEELEATDDIDLEAISSLRANMEGLEELSSVMLKNSKAEEALKMVLGSLDDVHNEPRPDFYLDLLDEDVPLYSKINELNAEYRTLRDSLNTRGSEIGRLINIEESMIPLLREEHGCADELTSMYTNMEQKKEKEEE